METPNTDETNMNTDSPLIPLCVQHWPDGKISLTEDHGGNVVAWIEPGLERYAARLATAFNANLAAEEAEAKRKAARTVRIVRDEDPENPRTAWDGNVGVMACWHRRSNHGDVQPKEDPEEWLAENAPEGSIVLPIFMHEHGGVAFSTGAFNDPWDSGQLGYIVATPERIRAQFLSPGEEITFPSVREKVIAALKAEVQLYENYVTGNVWGVVIEDGNGDTIDSCWGFYPGEGDTLESAGILDYVPDELHDAARKAWSKRYEG